MPNLTPPLTLRYHAWSQRLTRASLQLRDQKQVLSCLQKALKIANSCVDMAVQVTLFVEILNFYLVYHRRECETVSLSANMSISLPCACACDPD